ncbi:DUF3027 domain-containing protein [Rhodococcus sp. NPDC127528]|uniref:DUF3027 domain-containing protein n=1 Tax=unclassified Rhodococcus (in: high G+C Gram-positive bacteria) TaxID=192944 RepID=UPI003632F4B6
MSAQSAPELAHVRPLLADAVGLARQALTDLGEGEVGAHLGVTYEDECSATHRFETTLPGYRGWQWAVVLAAAPDSDRVTVSELALLPGPDALTAPDWLPWDERVRAGDLSPGDLLAPRAADPRLVPGYVASGDPEIDDLAREVGLGRKQVLSLEGRLDAAERWHDGDYGPDSEMAKAAPSICALCGFYLPLAGSMRAAFGVCGNEMAADGHVVHAEYGCGAHSDTELPTGAGSPQFDAYDDGAVELVLLPAPEETEAEAAPATESVTETEIEAAQAVEPESTETAADPASTD